ncbi:hypothetical protein ATJ93_0821 [Halopiger aswanensis]|uniref:Uncharacterized protein n=1 Tax=Halopiger aswanensis TaxID=148449 RepID=A0A3R7GL80_9EURY|nr:hypothetical protein ATJ93_0821 [Halopiger aswanensis]
MSFCTIPVKSNTIVLRDSIDYNVYAVAQPFLDDMVRREII